MRPGAQHTPGAPPSDDTSAFSVAAELLEALDASPEVAQRQFRDRLTQLNALFPETTEEYLRDILSKVDGDLERATIVMYAPGSPYHKKTPAPPAPLERPPAPDFSRHGSPWPVDATPSAPPTAPQPGPQSRALTVSIPAPLQLSPRARAMAVAIAAPTQPDREDTPMEDAAPAPDLVAPAPASPDSEPSSPLAPWHPTQDDIIARQDADYLRRMFPSIPDEFVTQAIREGDGDPAAAIAWATAITDADRTLGLLANAFPTATPEEVKEAATSRNGSATAAYTLLSRRHESAWDPDQFPLTTQTARRLLLDTGDMAPEFYDRDPAYAIHETKWWDTMLTTKAYKIADSAEDSALWNRISQLAVSRADVAPQTASHVESLATARYADRPAFDQSMKTLQTQGAFSALTRHCTANPEQTDSALRIVMALMEDGLASPGAAAWAMSRLTLSPQTFRAGRFCFAAYGANRRALWNRRNQALAAWRHTRDPPMEDAQHHLDLDRGASIGPLPSPAPSQQPPPGPISATGTPVSVHPRSLPGASGWALPLSESTSKYIDMAARPSSKRTRSASATGAGEPLEGQSDPGLIRSSHPTPGTTRPTAKGAKKEAAVALRKKEKEEARGKD